MLGEELAEGRAQRALLIGATPGWPLVTWGCWLAAAQSESAGCALAARRANCILGCLKKGIISRSEKVIVPLNSAPVQPHLEYLGSSGAHNFKKDVEVLECTQKTAKPVKGPEGMFHEEQLRASGLSSLEQRRLRGDLTALHSFLRGGEREVLSSSAW